MDIPVKKNNDYIIDINDIDSQGEGIGKIDGFTVFVENAVLGDKLKIKIVKIKKSYCYGKLLEIIIPSSNRVSPKCIYYNKCGGCQLQNYNYKSQLEFKSKKVENNLKYIAKIENIKVMPIISMNNPWNYRNKAQFPVRMKDGKIQIGFYSSRTHNIVDINTCHIQSDFNSKVIEIIKNFMIDYKISPYDEINHKGLIRHIFTRIGLKTNQIMVCIIINGNNLPYEQELVQKLKTINNITSIMLNYNTNKSNVIMGCNVKLLWGTPYIIDYIDDIKFMISPHSFFQVNPVQTEVLYKKVLDFAQLNGTEIIFDAYCGIGTISLFLAKKAKLVYGIEIVEEAIKDAKKNARLNSINNAIFYVGKSEQIIPKLYNTITPDIIIVDPPRKGCNIELIKCFIKMQPKKLIYISCEPSTLSRDLNILKNKYNIEKIQPVDLFPHSYHVECIVLMSRVESNV